VYAEQAADKLRSPNCQLRNNWSGGKSQIENSELAPERDGTMRTLANTVIELAAIRVLKER
jgi:hypothetical protein